MGKPLYIIKIRDKNDASESSPNKELHPPQKKAAHPSLNTKNTNFFLPKKRPASTKRIPATSKKRVDNKPSQVHERLEKAYEKLGNQKTPKSLTALLRAAWDDLSTRLELLPLKVREWLKANLWYADMVAWLWPLGRAVLTFLPALGAEVVLGKENPKDDGVQARLKKVWENFKKSYNRKRSGYVSKLVANMVALFVCGLLIFFLPFSVSGSAVLLASLGLNIVCPTLVVFGITIAGPVVAAVLGSILLALVLTVLYFGLYVATAMAQSLFRFWLKGDRVSWAEVRKDWFLPALFGATYWNISCFIPAFKPIIVSFFPWFMTYVIPGIGGATIPILYLILSGFFNAFGCLLAAILNPESKFFLETVPHEILKKVEVGEGLKAYFVTSFRAHVQFVKGFSKAISESFRGAIQIFIPTVFSGMLFPIIGSLPIGLPVGDPGAIFQPWLQNTRLGKVIHSLLLTLLTFGGTTFYAMQSGASEISSKIAKFVFSTVTFVPRKFIQFGFDAWIKKEGKNKKEEYEHWETWKLEKVDATLLKVKAAREWVFTVPLLKLNIFLSVVIAGLVFPLIWLFKQLVPSKINTASTKAENNVVKRVLEDLLDSGKGLRCEGKRPDYELETIELFGKESQPEAPPIETTEIFVNSRKELDAVEKYLLDQQREGELKHIKKEPLSATEFRTSFPKKKSLSTSELRVSYAKRILGEEYPVLGCFFKPQDRHPFFEMAKDNKADGEKLEQDERDRLDKLFVSG